MFALFLLVGGLVALAIRPRGLIRGIAVILLVMGLLTGCVMILGQSVTLQGQRPG